MISIHAPREGSDGFQHMDELVRKISIHAPREGSDRALLTRKSPCGRFLSTLPVRGATHCSAMAFECSAISIHAPREGSDA